MTDSASSPPVRESPRDRNYRTEAIVLTRLDLGEADRIVTLYTPHFGKLGIIAKGARRSGSKIGPALDYFGRVKLHLARGRDLDIVTSAELIDPHERLRLDLDAFGYASYYAELVRHLTQDRQENRQVYDLLKRSLSVLNEGVEPWPVTRHFELALLSALGYRPELLRCVNCRRVIEAEVNTFSATLGGLLCPMCRGMDPGAIRLSINAQKYLRELLRNGLSATIRLQPSEDERQEIERTTSEYLRFVSERDFSSLRVLSVLNRPSPRL
jgi:DNA repair protein RecO (recombination protein O)